MNMATGGCCSIREKSVARDMERTSHALRQAAAAVRLPPSSVAISPISPDVWRLTTSLRPETEKMLISMVPDTRQ